MSLRVQGYSLNVFEDNGETKVISDFENQLPLRFVTLSEFDNPLSKLHSEGVKTVTIGKLLDLYGSVAKPSSILLDQFQAPNKASIL